MKKILLLFFVGYTVTYAQIPFKVYDFQKTFDELPSISPVVQQNVVAYKSQVSCGDTVFWSEDFASGIPATWSTTSGGSYSWSYTTSGPTGLTAYALTSSSSGNGWVLADAYANGSAVEEASLITSAIDCSPYGGVILKFEHYFYQLNQATTSVWVSNDSTNWTEFVVNYGFAGNELSSNGEDVSINISAIAGGEPTVYLKFTWSSSALNVFWQVDDIQLVEAPQYDLTLDDSFTESFGYFAEHYSMIPSSQALTITYSPKIVNNGYDTATNAVVNAYVMNTIGDTVYSDSNIPVGVAPGYSDTLELQSTYTLTPELTAYDAVLTVSHDSSDCNTTDDEWYISFEVNDSVYAKDDGTQIRRVGPYFWGYDNMEVMMGYSLSSEDTLTGLSVYIDDKSKKDATMQARIMDWNFDLLFESNFYDLTGSDIGGWYSIPMPEGTILPADDYLISLYLLDAVPDSGGIFIGQSDKPTNGNLPYMNQYMTFDSDYSTIYWMNNYIPMLRLNFGRKVVGINDLETSMLSLGQNNPNPFMESTIINYELKTSGNILLTVYDMTGKIVFEQSEGKKNAGSYAVELNAKYFDSGVYFYSIQTENGILTRKMNVLK